MKRVFICSRYAGDVPRNTATAEQLCRKAVERGCAPFAPHLLYTRFLDDEKASEREAGIACGLTFMEICDEVWVFTGDGLSDGMRREVDHARRLGKPVVEPDLCSRCAAKVPQESATNAELAARATQAAQGLWRLHGAGVKRTTKEALRSPKAFMRGFAMGASCLIAELHKAGVDVNAVLKAIGL